MKALVFILFSVWTTVAVAQVNVFIDCPNNDCDMQYIKNNLTFVNYVRNIQDADVYTQILSQSTGSGGDHISISFEGQKDWEAQKNSITYDNEATNTPDEKRQRMLKHLKAGFLPFVAQTSAFNDVEISYTAHENNVTDTPVKDPWNYWLYTIEMGGDIDGQSSYKNWSGNGELAARRVTEDLKIALFVYGRTNVSQYDIVEDGETRTDTYQRHTYGTYNYAIKAISDRWSLGTALGFRSSSFDNQKEGYYWAPVVPEYNIFPYSEATKHVLRTSYRPALQYQVYEDTTIYNKKREFTPSHTLRMTFQRQAKFGTINAVVSAKQFLHKPEFYRIMLRSNLSIRILKGLNLELSGQFNWIRDQITLRRGSASEQDILTQQRELATSYSFWGDIGISYSFGSIYNNVVFPRFGGGL